VRAEADWRGLAVADKPDSHDVCFIADGDTRGFLADRLGTEPGPIVDSSGTVLGSHEGAYGFTVGQRKGLRIGDPAGDGRPRYVLDISPVTNTVTVGTAQELAVAEVDGDHVRWCGAAPQGSDASATGDGGWRGGRVRVPGAVAGRTASPFRQSRGTTRGGAQSLSG